jgi:hypothetical protein
MKLQNLWRKKGTDGGIKNEIFLSKEKKDALVLTFCKDTPEFLGLTIMDAKKFPKLKNWSHMLFTKPVILVKLIPAIYEADDGEISFVECCCFNEVLRIQKIDNDFYFNIYDNYADLLKRGIKTDIVLTEKETDMLCRTLSVYAKTELK